MNPDSCLLCMFQELWSYVYGIDDPSLAIQRCGRSQEPHVMSVSDSQKYQEPDRSYVTVASPQIGRLVLKGED